MADNLLLEYNGKVAFHPGSYVLDIIEDLGLTQSELAKRLQTSPKNICLLVNGKSKLSVTLAESLSKVSGTSIDLWINLQAKYDSLEEEKKSDDKIIEQYGILQLIDYNKLVGFGFVPRMHNRKEKIKELCRFLKVSSLEVLKQRDLAIDFRAAEIKNEKQTINTNVWIQMVSNALDNEPIKNFDAEKLKDSLKNLRNLTYEEPKEFIPKIKDILEECGVNFVLMPSIPNAQPKGMVMWKDGRIILGMSNKGTYADMFWFTLFHEIGHVLLHPNKDFVDLNHDSTEKKEEEADDFSRELLIPKDKFETFVSKNQFSRSSVEKFSNEVGVEKSIVIGRLQKENYISYSMLTKYKRQFIWSNH